MITNRHLHFNALGTIWKIKYTTDTLSDTKYIDTLIRERIKVFENTYSRFKENSLVGQIAQTPGMYSMPEDFDLLFTFYAKVYSLTSGKFTPLIGATLEALGYDKKYSFVKKDYCSKVPKLTDVLFYKKNVLKTTSPIQLDFGAAGKGFCVDIVAGLFEKHEIDTYTINAGGDMRIKNNKEVIGLEDPQDPKKVIGVVNKDSLAIAGSSGNRRKWEDMHHIIDPDTQKSPTDIISVWTIAKDTMTADGLATALYMVSPEILFHHFDFQYVILYKDYKTVVSKNFEGELFT